MSTGSNQVLSAEESQRYDRQVRIWGAEVQLRLQKSKVFLSGFFGLNCEVVKNIVLMGVSVVLHDTNLVREEDLSHNFFLSNESIGLNIGEAMLKKVQELNTLAKVLTNSTPLDELEDSYFQSFNVILLSNCTEKTVLRINQLARSKSPNSIVFWSGLFGHDSWFISDFGKDFEYKNDPPNNKEICIVQSKSIEEIITTKWSNMISKHFSSPPLIYIMSRILSIFRDKYGHYPSISDQYILSELTKELLSLNGLDINIIDQSNIEYLCRVSESVTIIPCSVLGSFLSQEVVKAISHTGKPYSNIWLFNTESFEVKGYPI